MEMLEELWQAAGSISVISKIHLMVGINSFSSYHGIVDSSSFCSAHASQTVLLQTTPLQKNSQLKKKATCL